MRMPMLNGLQVLMRVKEKFSQAQVKLDALLEEEASSGLAEDEEEIKRGEQITLVRPLIAYLS